MSAKTMAAAKVETIHQVEEMLLAMFDKVARKNPGNFIARDCEEIARRLFFDDGAPYVRMALRELVRTGHLRPAKIKAWNRTLSGFVVTEAGKENRSPAVNEPTYRNPDWQRFTEADKDFLRVCGISSE